MNADAEVMADLGGPLGRVEIDAKFDRYRTALDRDGVSRWALEDRAGRFVGYAGVMLHATPSHPLGPHYDVGWRLVRAAWAMATRLRQPKRRFKRPFACSTLMKF